MIIDIETENHQYFGAVASPRHPKNYVVACGQCIDTPTAFGPVTGEYFAERPKKWLSIPDDVWLLVAHNAAFELDWMLHTEREEITRFLKRGGRVFCTAYAEYLLTNQQETYPSLDETAVKYGGTHKVDGVKLLWEQGQLTSQIDKDLLFDQYLIGPAGDIENTRKAFYGQVQALQERGMWQMALVRMDGLVYNCFAMDAGLHVHRDTAFSLKATQEQALQALTETFRGHRQDIPQFVEFKESSDFHMSAWLFGGPVKYRIRDTWFEDDGVTPKYEKVECYTFGDQTVELGAGGMSADQFEHYVKQFGAVQRYASGKSKGHPKVVKVDSSTPKQKWYDRVFTLKPTIKLNLLPQDFRREFEREHTGKRKLSDGTPVFSTGSDCIQTLSLRDEFPPEIRELLKNLLKFAKIDKDLGTYYLREVCDEDGNVVKQSGMLQYLTEQDIVYHVLNTTSTVTTRLSSNRPNMQNIPRGDTSDVKKMFTSRFDNPNWLRFSHGAGIISKDLMLECILGVKQNVRQGAIIEADYSALEVVTLAAFSKDKALVDALLNNIDMHCMRLSKKLGEPYESVLAKCKDETHPDHKRYKTMRTDIKPKSFAYQYGATAMGIAFSTGCTVEEAQAFIDAEKALFPGVEKFYEDEVFLKVYASKKIHREQSDDGSWRPYGRGTWTAPGGTCYEFREYPKNIWADGQRAEIMEFKPTQMRNYPIQGESGYFVQGMAGQVMRWLVSEDFFGGRVFIINQVHDALYFDCHLSVLPRVAQVVKHIMEGLPEYFNGMGYDLQVPFPAEVEAGPSMYEKSKVKA
jgi:hypothetical protein